MSFSPPVNVTTPSCPSVPDITSFLAGWTHAADSAITFLMIEATMGAAEFVMLLSLLFFSTRATRRKPIFTLNLITILLGLAQATNSLYAPIHAITHPLSTVSPGNLITTAALSGLVPAYVDLTLLLRLRAVFPRHHWPWVLGIPLLLNTGRLANAIVYTIQFARAVRGGVGIDMIGPFVNANRASFEVELALQIVADMYASGLFLSKFYGLPSLWPSTGSNLSRKLATLFWLSATSFVLPVLLSIAELITYFTRRYDAVAYIQQVNYHFTVISVVFATVWAFEETWQDERETWTRDRARKVKCLREEMGLDSAGLEGGTRRMTVRSVVFDICPQPESTVGTAF
ncbi:hypothetical protein PENSPDRAFT_572123 [Peniophora sp. CONT]|nr:hypothetical protein PENSPDRAFT_572123 [Peniophora sp. CONT]